MLKIVARIKLLRLLKRFFLSLDIRYANLLVNGQSITIHFLKLELTNKLLMEAVTLSAFGPPSNLQTGNIPDPRPSQTDVLVKVKAIGTNPVETAIRSGMAFTEAFENLPHRVLGWDIAGEVVEVGSRVQQWQKGDPVFGMVNFPEPAYGYAAYVAAPADQIAKIPFGTSYPEAAGACLAALTAYQGLFQYGELQAGQKAVVLNAGGGVGHFAVQMAKHAGAEVFGTASGAKLPFLQHLGADHPIDYHNTAVDKVLQDADLVFDGVGGEATDQGLNALKLGGKMVSLMPTATDLEQKAQQQGKEGQLMMVKPSGTDMDNIAQLLHKDELRPHIEAAYLFREAYKAHQHLEAGRTAGKVILTVV
jgi:NADPH:quinone reductase-like Zn-dependent oxidoreductase